MKDPNYFVFSYSQQSAEGSAIMGRCGEGTLRVGDRFQAAFQPEPVNSDEPYGECRPVEWRRVDLQIRKIVAYRHELPEISHGLTGALFVVGHGLELLRGMDILVTEPPPD